MLELSRVKLYKIIGRKTKITSSYEVVGVIWVWVTEGKIIVNVWRKFGGNWVWLELVLRVDSIKVFWGLANLKLSCLAQSVECWTSITEDKSSNPWQAIQARLSGFLFVTAKGVSITTLTGMIFFTVLLPVWWVFFFTTVAFWYNNFVGNQEQWHYDCPCSTAPYCEDLQKVFWDTGFPLFEVRNSGMKLCTRGGMPKITIGITVLHEI